MIFAGMNFGLRYELIFYKRWKQFKNKEFLVYTSVVALITIAIVILWNTAHPELSLFDQLRWAFFSVASIISTTGLANYDFASRPV
jgi:trk system potassium uptake protein TrkH